MDVRSHAGIEGALPAFTRGRLSVKQGFTFVAIGSNASFVLVGAREAAGYIHSGIGSAR